MKERINAKVSDVVEYILKKPVETVTGEDYSILMDELRKIQANEGNDSFKFMIPMLMAMLATSSPCK